MAPYDTTTYLLDRANITDVCMRLVRLSNPPFPHLALRESKAKYSSLTNRYIITIPSRPAVRPVFATRSLLRRSTLTTRPLDLRKRRALGGTSGWANWGRSLGCSKRHSTLSGELDHQNCLLPPPQLLYGGAQAFSGFLGKEEDLTSRPAVLSSSCRNRDPRARDPRRLRSRRMPRGIW